MVNELVVLSLDPSSHGLLSTNTKGAARVVEMNCGALKILPLSRKGFSSFCHYTKHKLLICVTSQSDADVYILPHLYL